MANEHPFQNLFETLGRLPIAHADSVNRQAYEILHDLLSVPLEKPGRCILLRAPRAGHGKTHLLSRIQHQLGATHEFIPLHAAYGCQINASTAIDDTLGRLLRPLPASGGLCALDLVTRRLFATALQPLVASGEVPCQDREGALAALRTRPIETFDFHHPNAVTAHWAHENFGVLGQRLSIELAQRSGQPMREVGFWVDAMFRFAATPVENQARLHVLTEMVHLGSPGEVLMVERLQALLGLVAQLVRVVLVADDLEGFSTDETAALRLAAFLGGLRQSVERVDVILSLNLDVWESAFLPRLSGGLSDRLSEVVVELKPLSDDEMLALLESRVPGLGAQVLARLDRASAGTHARGLIRAAGVAWLRASAMDAKPPIAVAVRPEPPVQPDQMEGSPVPVSSFAGYEDPSVEVPPSASGDIWQSPAVQPAASERSDSPQWQEEPPAAVVPEVPAPEVPSEPATPETAVAVLPRGDYGIAPPSVPPEPLPASSEPQPARRGPPPVPPEALEREPAEVETFDAAAAMRPPAGETPSSGEEVPQEEPSAFESESAPPVDSDRVDELLRQFRERYGRGGP